MNARELIDTARTLVAGDKGLLAVDGSNPTCNKVEAAKTTCLKTIHQAAKPYGRSTNRSSVGWPNTG